MLKKLFITPWFGPFPEWIDKYREHIKHLEQYGYEWLFFTDIDDFERRIAQILDITPQVSPGTSLSHNYRTSFGLLFEKELQGYDYWGITDLDCVYGNPEHFVSDAQLKELDIWSNHHNYICGPWTLFKNNEKVNNLFRLVPNWEEFMSDTQSQSGRWTEVQYSEIVDREHEDGRLKRLYTHHQGKDPNDDSSLQFKEGMLYDHKDEIMTFHFNRHKRWPL